MANFDTIESVFVRQYADAYTILCEQKESKLRQAVTYEGQVQGTTFTVNELGEAGVGYKPVRNGDTQYGDIEFASRVAFMVDHANFVLVPIQDLKKLKAQPTDTIMQRLLASRNRKIDSVIYGALTGVAKRKTTDADTWTDVALPATQVLGDDVTKISKQLLIDVRTKFMANEVPDDETIYLTYNADMLNAVLADTTLTSADYTTGQMLQRGEISNFLGFEWVHYEGIKVDEVKALGVAFTRNGIHFGDQAISPLKIEEVELKNRANSIGYIDAYGAVRSDEKRVVAFKFMR